MSEKHEQIAVIDWFNMQHKSLKGCLMAIPNAQVLSYMGSKEKIARMYNSLKRQGFKPGVSDLFLAAPSAGFHGLWLEMKDIGKKDSDVSQAQLDHLDLMAKQGYMAVWCAGAQSAIDTINGYLKASR